MSARKSFLGTDYDFHDKDKTKKLACARCDRRTKHAAHMIHRDMWVCITPFKFDVDSQDTDSWQSAPGWRDGYCGVVRRAKGNAFPVYKVQG